MLDHLDLYVPSVVMAILFVYLIRLIIVSQNPQKRAEARARELDAERNDPRFVSNESAPH
ncbi:MAG: hypothetical protein AUG49_26530 [Catenulispora sp. 13_1_20CM_3_70_7]|jgi:hypothetical protein|nr:MAG: hypothetical protein AUG49_26530 [Catenulispora sp. 13_1_20CM_3_70_7]